MFANVDNFGLSSLRSDPELLQKFIAYSHTTGRVIRGYGKTRFISRGFGDFDVLLQVGETENGKSEIEDFHLQGNTPNVWKMRYTGIDLTQKERESGDCIFVFRREGENASFLPIHILTPQIIPGFIEGELYQIQVCGIPNTIQYFSNEEECDKVHSTEWKGKRMSFACDRLYPLPLVTKQSVSTGNEAHDAAIENAYVVFKGTVKKLFKGMMKDDDKEECTFIWCVIETQFGEIRLCHTYSQLDESSKENIKVGAVAMGTCLISGDVAIYDYSDGIQMDLRHHLMLFRSVFTEGRPERLAAILDKNAVYESPIHREDKASEQQKVFRGAKEILEMFERILKIGVSCKCEMAITSEGVECLSLAYHGVVETLAFLDLDEKGFVTHIRLEAADDHEWKEKVREVIQNGKELFVGDRQVLVGEVQHWEYDAEQDEILKNELNTNRFLSVKSVERAWADYTVEKLSKRLSDDFEWDSAWSDEIIRGKEAFLNFIQDHLDKMKKKLIIAPNLHVVKLKEALYLPQYGYAIYYKNKEEKRLLVFEFEKELIRRISLTDPDFFSFELTGL